VRDALRHFAPQHLTLATCSMNTPSHAIVNYALLSGLAPTATLPIVLGAILPDVPMLVLIVWAKLNDIPGPKIWSELYWQPFWQDFTHYFHSIPIALALALLAYGISSRWPQMPHIQWIQALQWLSLSMVLHSLGDLPLHHDDAHRHFLPFSQFRFISPVSYWDRRHNALWGALAENLAVLASTLYLLPSLPSLWLKGGLIFLNAIAWTLYGMVYWIIPHRS
jgi:hypothetical protein